MIQFDLLIKEGVYNVLYSGGMGNIVTTSAPFGEARLLAQQAYALQRGGPLPYSDNDPAPAAGVLRLVLDGLLQPGDPVPRCSRSTASCSPCRTSPARRFPSPTPRRSSTPTPSGGGTSPRSGSSKYGKAVDLFDRDDKTKRILEKLDEPISMSFNEETPLEDVLKYIKQATTTATYRASRSTSIRSASRKPRRR